MFHDQSMTLFGLKHTICIYSGVSLLNLPLTQGISLQGSEQNQHQTEMGQHTMPEVGRVGNTK